jgi:hypothetical protein
VDDSAEGIYHERVSTYNDSFGTNATDESFQTIRNDDSFGTNSVRLFAMAIPWSSIGTQGELVQVTWNVNCSDGFIGECAPSFAVQPEAIFSLNSPVYCFSSDYIELSPALEVYQFDQLTANSADFGACNLRGTLTNNGFSVERVFTIDSQLYAEYCGCCWHWCDSDCYHSEEGEYHYFISR